MKFILNKIYPFTNVKGYILYYALSFSFKSSSAILTAAITKAENVQFFPTIAASTSSIMSLGNLMDLLEVGGELGILNFAMFHLVVLLPQL